VLLLAKAGGSLLAQIERQEDAVRILRIIGKRTAFDETVWLLCACSERPRSHCSSNSCNKIASSHCPTRGSGLRKFGIQLRPSKQEFATSEMGLKGQFALQKPEPRMS
jgi:hypothetical protein